MSLEPIAIVGIGCRFPGANNPQEFWQLLCNGVDAITEVPPSRWDIERFYDSDPSQPDKSPVRWGGFLEQVDGFDPQFFGIAPREAITMDPQQRLLLEVAWESLEDAGQIPAQLAGTKTGVFIGIGTHDYSILLWHKPINEPYATTGTGNCIAANRISYSFDFKGPSLAIDTACSSSLVAVHLACQSLWQGESSLALAGGVNVLLLPTTMVGFAKGGFLSAEGRCKSFDASADGYVRSEGAGMVVLKPLSQAKAEGDAIYALIRGSAVNQDGSSQGLAAPNLQAQVAVLRDAYRHAAVSPRQIQYVEAHGTGTQLGDRIEMQALGTVFAAEGRAGESCVVGSVKTNIGHAETAAGIAGLIKVALSLQHRQIPPNLHFHTPNPAIDFEGLPLQVPVSLRAWPQGAGTALAGVNSFGFGGTNAHVVLAGVEAINGIQAGQSGCFQSSSPPPTSAPTDSLLTLAAKSEAALKALAQSYATFLDTHPELSLREICFSANTRRSPLMHRAAFVADSSTGLRQQLTDFASTQAASLASPGNVKGSSKIAFLFSGQGSQYQDMGKALYETQPLFRDVLERCQAILRPYLDQPLLAVLYPTANDRSSTSRRQKANLTNPEALTLLDQTAYTQPALFALEYALAQLWMSWGIVPDVVMGHSVGEYVAACIAGVFELDDALTLIAIRGQLMQSLPAEGAMAVVGAKAAQVRQLLDGVEGEVAIAAINHPRNTVISGDRAAITVMVEKFVAQGIQVTPLPVSHAFHSPLMAPILADFAQQAQHVNYAFPKRDIISNLTGNFADQVIATPGYWCNHIVQPVQFAASMATLKQHGYHTFVEIGPQSTLLGMGRYCYAEPYCESHCESHCESPYQWLPSLSPSQSDWQPMLQSLGALYVNGQTVDWFNVYGREKGDSRASSIRLPTYPFQRQRFWWPGAALPETGTLPLAAQSPTSPIHPLLGQRLESDGQQEIRFQAQISPQSPIYLQDHCLDSQPVFPATAYIEMALAAGNGLFSPATVSLTALTIEQPLLLFENQATAVQLRLQPAENNGYTVQIYSLVEPEEPTEAIATLHASGTLFSEQLTAPDVPQDLAQRQRQYASSILSLREYYQQLQAQGFNYGPSFQGIQQLWLAEKRSLGRIQLPETLVSEDATYVLHPVLLDACFQVVGAAIGHHPESMTYLPTGLTHLRQYRSPGQQLWCEAIIHDDTATMTTATSAQLTASLQLWDEDGRPVATIEALRFQLISAQSRQRLLHPLEPLEQWLYEVTWQAQSLADAPDRAVINLLGNHSPTPWLLFVHPQGIGVQLAQQLREQGESAILVMPGQAYRCINPQLYHINPVQLSDFQTLFNHLKSEATLPLCRIIYLWSQEEFSGVSELDLTTLLAAQTQGCEGILHLVQALLTTQSSPLPKLWLITRGTQIVENKPAPVQIQQAAVWGLGRSLHVEHPELNCTCLDLDPNPTDPEITTLCKELQQENSENQIAYRQGIRHVARLVSYQAQTSDHATELSLPTSDAFQLTLANFGDLEQLTLVSTQRPAPQPQEVEIQVYAVGVNFRDVLNALGLLQEFLEPLGISSATDLPLGWECTGIITKVGEKVTDFQVGDDVIAAAAVGCLGSFVTVAAEFVIQKPSTLSFAAAATIPTTFLTAHYGLHHCAKIQPGDRILIHAAAGGVGQAAIQIAQQAGAEIWATASPGKWQFLKSQGIQHVMNSRNLNFAQQIMEQTKGEGVNIILNCLNGEFISKNLESLAKNGRFIEIGKLGIWDKTQIHHQRPDITYHPFDLLTLSQQNPALIATLFKQLMPAFQQRELKPLFHQTFPIQSSRQAFRYIAQAKHIGKVVITLPVVTTPRRFVKPDLNSSYLITGGLGALGLQLADWLVEQGAKHLVLMARNEAKPEQQTIIRQLETKGTCIHVLQADVTQPEDINRLIPYYQNPDNPVTLRGVIHAAGYLDDGVLAKLSWTRFYQVMGPKLAGTWNLHQATQGFPLDFFICFSSITAILSTAGQGNYSAANAFMDTFVHYRQALGLPALSINWGPWAIGMTGQLKTIDRKRMTAQGLKLIQPHQGLFLLDKLIKRQNIQAAVLPINWTTFFKNSANQVNVNFLEKVKPTLKAKQRKNSLILQKIQQTSAQEHPALLLEHIRSQLAKILGFTNSDLIDPQEKFADLGMDSLMAVEFKNSLQSSLNMTIPQTITFDYPTAEKLTDYLLQESLKTSLLNESSFDARNNQKNDTEYAPKINIAPPKIAEKPRKELPLASRIDVAQSTKQSKIKFSNTPPKIPEKFYRFPFMEDYLNLRRDIERAEEIGNPFFIVHEGIANNITYVNGKKQLNYSSYDYLGMSGDPAISQAATQAIERYGTSVSASRIVSGERPIHQALEREIAALLGTKDCIVYIGGHATNVTTIGHLFNEDDLIIYDQLCHNSIIEGCRLSGAACDRFAHNDYQSLADILAKKRTHYKKVLIVIEGIYSTDGDLAPLPQIVDIKKHYKTFLMVDEAHSIGVLGQFGGGIREHFRIPSTDVDLWMGTLSKSFASCGGYIAGCKELVEYLKYSAPGFVYSVGMSPPVAAAALASIQRLKSEPERVTRLHQSANSFLSSAKQMGLNTGASHDSPIIPIIVGEPYRAVQLAQQLFQRDIHVQPMVYPSVPYHAARLRFFLTCKHSESEIDHTIDVIKEVMSQ